MQEIIDEGATAAEHIEQWPAVRGL